MKRFKNFFKTLFMALADISMCDVCDYDKDPLCYVEGF